METVREYFTGKSIFITGVTGFIGKALVEKLWEVALKLEIFFALYDQREEEMGKKD